MHIDLKLGMLRIGEIYFASVGAEIYNEIANRLKRESPAAKLMKVALANGRANSGYVYSNRASSYHTFQVIGSRLKPGCAEDRIVTTHLSLLKESLP